MQRRYQGTGTCLVRRLLTVLHQSGNGTVERLGRLDDVVILPEDGVEEVINLVVEGITQEAIRSTRYRILQNGKK